MKEMLNFFEEQLNLRLEKYDFSLLKESMKYSLQSGGKRIRPLLCMSLADSLGFAYEKVVDIALSIEFIHSYSLVHDDLPCMDNDMYRRGKLTTHAKYGEYMGVLAGDGLLTIAYENISSSENLEKKVILIKKLSKYVYDMIYGQTLDMYYENKEMSFEILNKIHINKTGALICACFDLVLEELNIDEVTSSKYMKIAEILGKMYQIKDDLKDMENKKDKSNYANLVGYDNAINELNRYMLFIEENIEKNSLYNLIKKIFEV